MTKINNLVYSEAKTKYESLLVDGAFPEVEFKIEKTSLSDGKEYTSRSYNMMGYGFVFSRISKLIDVKLKEYGHPEGVFISNRKNRNQRFISDVKSIINSLTVESINAQTDRFKTMFD